MNKKIYLFSKIVCVIQMLTIGLCCNAAEQMEEPPRPTLVLLPEHLQELARLLNVQPCKVFKANNVRLWDTGAVKRLQRIYDLTTAECEIDPEISECKPNIIDLYRLRDGTEFTLVFDFSLEPKALELLGHIAANSKKGERTVLMAGSGQETIFNTLPKDMRVDVREFVTILPLPGSLECPVCLEGLADDFMTTACGHIFHKKCMENWEKAGGRDCPYCKQAFKRKQSI
jgi:hypothetical protein